jgi:hypothetical protein
VAFAPQTSRCADTSIDSSISPRCFLDLCLREHAARLGRYDARLLRPVLVPAIARVVRALLPG